MLISRFVLIYYIDIIRDIEIEDPVKNYIFYFIYLF